MLRRVADTERQWELVKRKLEQMEDLDEPFKLVAHFVLKDKCILECD